MVLKASGQFLGTYMLADDETREVAEAWAKDIDGTVVPLFTSAPAPARPEDTEGVCMSCKEDYSVWSADNELWNRVMRLPDGSDRVPFICPTCFMRAADQRLTDQIYRVSLAPERRQTSEEPVAWMVEPSPDGDEGEDPPWFYEQRRTAHLIASAVKGRRVVPLYTHPRPLVANHDTGRGEANMSTGQRTTVESHSERTARLWESLQFWLDHAIGQVEWERQHGGSPARYEDLIVWLERAKEAHEVTAIDEAIEYTLKAYEIALTLRKHLRGH